MRVLKLKLTGPLDRTLMFKENHRNLLSIAVNRQVVFKGASALPCIDRDQPVEKCRIPGLLLRNFKS